VAESIVPESRAGLLLAGRYRLDQVVATGGMAQVWSATDEVLTRHVAVKVLHPHLAADETFVDRFRAEAVAAARLTHHSIVAIYDTCSTGGTEAIVMELVRGTNLRRHLDERGPLDAAEACGIVAQVADALDAAHRAGIVHRDIKPANVLLALDGRVLVTDFGIATTVGRDGTPTGDTLGTVKYLAPEQVEGGAVDARTDVYALGAVLYEALCGRAPFVADTDAGTALARLHQHPMRPRQVRAGIPRAVEDVVLRALARDPDDRYPSAADFRAALLTACRGDVAVPTASTDYATGAPVLLAPNDAAVTGAPTSFGRSERRLLVPAALIVFVAVALGTSGWLWSRTDTGRSIIGKVKERVGVHTATAPAPTTITEVRAFDPFGDEAENDDRAALAADGDPATAWSTEGYRTRAFGGLKPGVGLVVTVSSSASLDELQVQSANHGWGADVYVAATPGDDLDAWGQPVASENGVDGTATFDLEGHEGTAVMLWITDLGDGPAMLHAEIAELQVSA
jgi:serine/threonine-protein kinase